MSQYTPVERSEIVELYIKNQNSIILTQRAFRAKFPRKKAPDPKTIRALYAKFKSTGILSNVPRPIIHRRARSNINITIAQELLQENPNLSTERGAQALGISKRAMLNTFLRSVIKKNNLIDYWFQQDGATAHTARLTIYLLNEMFPSRLVSKKGDFDWPPRSPDLTAPDFFLWGYLKGKVYTNQPKTLTVLKENIRQEIAAIGPDTLKKVMENAKKRAQLCVKEKGKHLRDIIFHT